MAVKENPVNESNGKAATGLSKRGSDNVDAIMPKIQTAVSERVKVDNPSIDLATAENWLLRDELVELCKKAINEKLTPADFSYPRAFAGFPDVLNAFAAFFNNYFNPHVPVEQSHLATAPGAASCLDTFLYNVCDPGDGVLVPSPYWSGFDFQFKARSSAVPVAVPVVPLSATMTSALIPALEKAFEEAKVPIKALLMTNPQNPLGQCYSRSAIEDCMRFCQARGIHYISDEVYAMTFFDAHEIDNPVPFMSALSIDLQAIGVDGRRVHAFWSTSKDFGQSGCRMGCSVSQFSPEMAVGLALASNTQTSTLSSIFVASLLTSPELPQLLKLNSQRLLDNYRLLTSVLVKCSIEYIPSYAGLYLFAKVAASDGLQPVTLEDEAAAVANAKKAGVLISAGAGYHGHKDVLGWARIGFAVDHSTMAEACKRLEKAFTAQKHIS